MGKIWEVDFTSFSGSSSVAYDNIGTQHLTAFSGVVIPARISGGSLPGFSFRPGVALHRAPSGPDFTSYSLQLAGATNAYWQAPYTTRSFVTWIYVVGGTDNSTFWQGGGARAPIWAARPASVIPNNGFGTRSSNPRDFSLMLNNNQVSRASPFVPAPDTWHCLAATIDRGSNVYKFYINGELVNTSSGAGFQPASGVALGDQFIGHQDFSNSYSSFNVGYAATYDHILTSGEVAAIYNTFLVDSTAGDDPYQTFSGVVNGLDGLPASGVNVLLIHNLTQDVEASQVTNVSGYYEMVVPYAGDYTVVATNTPAGCRAFPMTAVSGGVYFP